MEKCRSYFMEEQTFLVHDNLGSPSSYTMPAESHNNRVAGIILLITEKETDIKTRLSPLVRIDSCPSPAASSLIEKAS